MTLRDLFHAQGIVCAHVIDDAFDEVPSYPLSAEETQAFLEEGADEDFAAIGAILGIQAGETEVRRALQEVDSIQRLHAAREKLSGPAADHLFGQFERDKEGKRAQVQPLVDLLVSAGIECATFGRDYKPAGSNIPQLLFVDLKLREGPDAQPNHEDAVKVFNALLEEHKGCKPLVFLMSSLATVLPEKREAFRKDAGLFQSEFEDLEKGIFANGDELERILGSHAKSLTLLTSLREKMEGFEVAVHGAAKKVMKEMRALDLADYFVLRHNTMAVEKAKLGAYIVEMLLEYLAHEVEGQSQVWDLAGVLDSLELKKLPRARFGITKAASALYSSNMVHAPAMLYAEDGAHNGPADGYFFTGDIFFPAQSTMLTLPHLAYAVITPACDLVRPDMLKGRSIMLCEGTVTAINPSSKLIAKDGLPITVLPDPRVAGKFIGIEWNKKKLHVWDAEDRAKFSDPATCTLIRAGRLRPVFALQLQHAVTSDLSRVGTQKPPDALIPHRVRCLVSDSNTWKEVYFNQNADGAALCEWEDGDKKKYALFVLADPTIHKSFVEIQKWISANPNLQNMATLVKATGDDVRDALRGFTGRVEKSDPTVYPLVGLWGGADEKQVALVRENTSSPYAGLASGQAVKKDRPGPCIVFKFEALPVIEDPAVEVPQAAPVADALTPP